MKNLKNQRGIAGIVEVALVVLVLGVLGFAGWRVYQAQNPKEQKIDNGGVGIDIYADWKTYDGPLYKFKYPKNWEVQAKGGTTGYDAVVDLTSGDKKIGFLFSPMQYPYGFEDPSTELVSKTISVKLLRKDFTPTEITINGKTAYVDIDTKVKGDPGSTHHVLYGSGYPAGGSSASLHDYEDAKDEIELILGSLEIK